MKLEKLRNIADFKMGQAPHSDTYNNKGEGTLLIKAGDFGFHYPTPTEYTTNPISFSEEGDILICVVGATSGKVNKGINASITRSIAAIRVNKEKLNSDFLFYYLRSSYRKLNKMTSGSAQGIISKPILAKINIPLPPLPDQLHIANLLSKAENLIAQRKESIRLLDEFLKSTFLEMFGDIQGKEIALSEACILNPKKSEISSVNKKTEVSFIPMASVSEKGEVDLSQTRILESVWSGFTYFRENDVTFAKITPCMENGKGAIMRGLKNQIGFGTTEFHVLRPIENISNSEWLYHLTMQHSFRESAEQNMTGSAGQKRVPSEFFSRFKIVLPPLDLQNQFARIVEKTEAIKSQYQQSLQELENLYGSLSQKAFRGELSVKQEAVQ